MKNLAIDRSPRGKRGEGEGRGEGGREIASGPGRKKIAGLAMQVASGARMRPACIIS